MLLFFSPGKNTHQKDCDFQRAYLQPTHCYKTAHSLAQLADFYVFYCPGFCLSCNICFCACKKIHTNSWLQADPAPQRQNLLTIAWNSHVFYNDRVAKAMERVEGVGEIKAMCHYFGKLRRQEATMGSIA